ncbi:MAG TPA: hypothetical protein VN956_15850 [Pyrinomonadaceae bacterium]|nr:hypothetical protein [Pyrinomonadaceae bacterium]
MIIGFWIPPKPDGCVMSKRQQKERPQNRAADQPSDRQSLSLTVNKATNEIIFTDPSGKVFVVRPEIIEPQPSQEEEYKPLSVEEFRRVLDELDSLGITWSTDIPPSPAVKDLSQWTPPVAKKYAEIQKKYPRFPNELGNVILHALLGRKQPSAIVGDEKTLSKKSEIVQSHILTQEYRSEFFFKYAIKVPYLQQVDWEIVVKAYEKNVQAMPRVAYALLSLTLGNPIDITLPLERGARQPRGSQSITVALNEKLIEKIMSELKMVKEHLERAQESARSLTEQSAPTKGGGDESST